MLLRVDSYGRVVPNDCLPLPLQSHVLVEVARLVRARLIPALRVHTIHFLDRAYRLVQACMSNVNFMFEITLQFLLLFDLLGRDYVL